MTCECSDNWNSWSFGDPVLHLPRWIQCDLLKPITLSLSSHMIQSINNNPWRHWKDPQTSQVNKCLDTFRKCATGSKLRIAYKKKTKKKTQQQQKIQGKLLTLLEPLHTSRLKTSVYSRQQVTYRWRWAALSPTPERNRARPASVPGPLSSVVRLSARDGRV